MNKQQKQIGILSLQGSFAEHKKMMDKLSTDVFLVNDLADVQSKQIDGIIFPGGESTTMKKLLKKTGLDKWIINQGKKGLSIYGTCAGMILLAEMGLIDVDIERNAYGGQLNSFETLLKFETNNLKFEIPGIFIRAPRINSFGDGVEVLAKYDNEPVLLKQKNIMISSFHPELTDNTRIHEYFLKM